LAHDPLLGFSLRKRVADYWGFRFAAKEAAIKAHQTQKLTFQDIWIRKQKALAEGNSGAPEAVIKADGSWEKGWTVPISISHDQGFATAVCMADQTVPVETITNKFGAPLVEKVEKNYTEEVEKMLSDAKRYKMEIGEQLKDIRAMKERLAAANVGRIPEDVSVTRRNVITDTLDDVQRSQLPIRIKSKPGSLIRKHYTNPPVIRPVLANIHATENLTYFDPKGEVIVPSNQDIMRREGSDGSRSSSATIRRTTGKGQDNIENEGHLSPATKEVAAKEEEAPHILKLNNDPDPKTSLNDDVFKDEIFGTRDVRIARWKAKETEGRLKRTLFVRNVDRNCSLEYLQDYFSNSGSAKCRIYIYKTEAGDHLGTAAVVYDIVESARTAQKLFNNAIMLGKPIEVLEFSPVEQAFAKDSVVFAKNEAAWSKYGDFDRSLYKPEPLPPRSIDGSDSQYIRVDKKTNVGVDTIVRRERGVYITNVAKEATTEDIEALFKDCSSEVNATILHARNGDFRGVAVVVLKLKEEAKAARVEMMGKVLYGKEIKIKDGPT